MCKNLIPTSFSLSLCAWFVFFGFEKERETREKGKRSGFKIHRHRQLRRRVESVQVRVRERVKSVCVLGVVFFTFIIAHYSPRGEKEICEDLAEFRALTRSSSGTRIMAKSSILGPFIFARRREK